MIPVCCCICNDKRGIHFSIFFFFFDKSLFQIYSLCSTRVSNELGAGKPQAARLAVYVVLGMAVTVGTIVGIVLISIRNIWGYAYSNDVQVVRYVAIMLPIVAASNFLDGLQCVLSGSLSIPLARDACFNYPVDVW